MKIKINVESKILKKFEIDNLPDFIVVTGENGSGKTQLLKILSIENFIEEKFENETFIQYSNSEIFDGEKKLNNINYISNNDEMQGHYNINLGQNITPQVYINKWGRLPIKYISFLNLKKISSKNINLKNLNERYQKDIGNNNSITQADLNLFEKIYSQKTNKFELATIEECIINLPFSNNNNLFSTDLTLLYIKHKCKLDLGIIPKEKPWDIFNEILEEANFPYRLNPPDFSVENFNLRANLVDIKSKKIIEIPNLSSGEKTIMSLILALYNSKNEITFPEVILFDEPDSVLHPSMSKQMLDVLQNIFVRQQQVKVIITTHSPSTVALSPELSIYKMDRDLGMLLKTEKKEAINNLTKGLDNLNIYYENRRQIFVEANIDKLFYENTYSNIKSLGYLNRQIHLEFITMSETKQNGDVNGGCDFVKKIVNRLHKSGSKTAFGLIDYDNGNNHKSSVISILGNNERHSIENYILDPIFIAFFILREIENKKLGFGFDVYDKITNFQKISKEKLQNIVNKIVTKIEPNISDLYNSEIVSYKTLNDYIIKVPIWYFKTKGHILEEIILKSIYDLRGFTEKNSICPTITKKVINIIPEFIALDLLKTFEELEYK